MMKASKPTRWLGAGIAVSALSLAAHAQLGAATDDRPLLNIVASITQPIGSVINETIGGLIQPPTVPVAPASPALQNASSDVADYDFSAVRRVVQNENTDTSGNIIIDNPIPDMVLIIGDASGNLAIFRNGTFDPNGRTSIASASKWLIGTMGQRMAQANQITMTDRASRWIDFWTTDGNDPRSRVTFEQALSMQSGFNAQPLEGECVQVPLVFTLKSCTRLIHDLYPTLRAVPSISGGSLLPGLTILNGVEHQASTDPATTFSYGPHQLQIAAAMMEGTSQFENFNSLFRRHVTEPLGMTDTTYDHVGTLLNNGQVVLGPNVNPIDLGAHVNNPWAAGGAVSTAYDYAKLLRGFFNPSFIADLESFTRPRTLNLDRGFVPGSTRQPTGTGFWHYALGSFVECAEPEAAKGQQTCASKINSSPGAYGWLGWIDRENGYYALIARGPTFQNDGDGLPYFGDQSSIVLERKLQPLIAAAIRAGRAGQ